MPGGWHQQTPRVRGWVLVSPTTERRGMYPPLPRQSRGLLQTLAPPTLTSPPTLSLHNATSIAQVPSEKVPLDRWPTPTSTSPPRSSHYSTPGQQSLLLLNTTITTSTTTTSTERPAPGSRQSCSEWRPAEPARAPHNGTR